MDDLNNYIKDLTETSKLNSKFIEHLTDLS